MSDDDVGSTGTSLPMDSSMWDGVLAKERDEAVKNREGRRYQG